MESWIGFWWCAGLALGGALLYLTASNGMEGWTCLWWCARLALGGALLYLTTSNGIEIWICFWQRVGLTLESYPFTLEGSGLNVSISQEGMNME